MTRDLCSPDWPRKVGVASRLTQKIFERLFDCRPREFGSLCLINRARRQRHSHQRNNRHGSVCLLSGSAQEGSHIARAGLLKRPRGMSTYLRH